MGSASRDAPSRPASVDSTSSGGASRAAGLRSRGPPGMGRTRWLSVGAPRRLGGVRSSTFRTSRDVELARGSSRRSVKTPYGQMLRRKGSQVEREQVATRGSGTPRAAGARMLINVPGACARRRAGHPAGSMYWIRAEAEGGARFRAASARHRRTLKARRLFGGRGSTHWRIRDFAASRTSLALRLVARSAGAPSWSSRSRAVLDAGSARSVASSELRHRERWASDRTRRRLALWPEERDLGDVRGERNPRATRRRAPDRREGREGAAERLGPGAPHLVPGGGDVRGCRADSRAR